MSQTTDGEHIYSKSPLPALWLSRQSKSSKRRSASFQRREGVNGAAAHWLILARSSGSESELSAVRFSTYSFVGGIHERTLRSRHASLRRTGHRRNRSSPILNYQAPGARPDFLRYHGMSIIANHMLLFLCCERSRNMGGHRSSGLHQLRIEYGYEKRGHDGRHGLVDDDERKIWAYLPASAR